MHRKRLWLLLFYCLALGMVAGPAVAAPPRQSETDYLVYLPAVRGVEGSAEDDFAAEVVALVNEERAAAGCSPLAGDERLAAAAQGHSEDMAVNDFFSHTGSDGTSPWDRMEAAGYAWSRAAENIAAGYGTPEEVVAGWMGSTGHRENILDCALVDTGVGCVYLAEDGGSVNYHQYWTQVFGAPR